MPFDPSLPFKTLSEFNPNRPFERVGFDPDRPFNVVDELLDNLKIKTLEKPIVVPPKKEVKKVIGKYVEPIKKDPLSLTAEEITALVQREIARLPKPKPEKVIEKIIEKQIIKEENKSEKKDYKKYVEEKTIDALKKEVSDLKEMLEKFREILPMMSNGGSGVIGLPGMAGQAGKTLTNDGTKPSWTVSSSSGSGSDPIYIPDSTTEGSWRITISGVNLSFQRLESSTWNEKFQLNP